MKVSNDSPGRRSLGGRSFHRRGPATEKLLSPSLLCVRGTSMGLASGARARGLALHAPENSELAGGRRDQSSAVGARIERYIAYNYRSTWIKRIELL